MPAPAAAAPPVRRERGGGEDEQPGRRVGIAGLPGRHRGGVRGQDPGPCRMVGREPVRVRLGQRPGRAAVGFTQLTETWMEW